jgi:UDP-N-acetylmuramoylalanine--D-glutamate ligase
VAQPLSVAALDSLTSWHSPWAGAKAVVVGLGDTGFAIVDTLVELGVDVLVVARSAASDVTKITGVIGAQALVDPDGGVRAEAAAGFGADFAVVSPGIDPEDPAVSALGAAGVPVWSDVDFAWRVRDKDHDPAQWIVVVGSLTSVKIAELAARILVADGRSARHVGFGASPLLDALRDPHPYDTLVIAASDESVHWWGRLPSALRRPVVSVSIEATGESTVGTRFDGTAMACIYRRGTGPSESMVVDADVMEGARAVGIGLDAPGMSDIGVVEGIVCDRAFLEDRAHHALEVSTIEELNEAGWSIPDDLPILLAAMAIARAEGVAPPLIAGVVSLP